MANPNWMLDWSLDTGLELNELRETDELLDGEDEPDDGLEFDEEPELDEGLELGELRESELDEGLELEELRESEELRD